jgi:hypothetical protein
LKKETELRRAAGCGTGFTLSSPLPKYVKSYGSMKATIRRVPKLMVVVAGLMSAAGLSWLPLAQETETVPGWSVTGGLSSIRSGYTATLLPNGKVLVAGGEELLLALVHRPNSALYY